jgi:hypothetical protein
MGSDHDSLLYTVSSSSIPQLFHNSSATSPVSESVAVGWTYGLYLVQQP